MSPVIPSLAKAPSNIALIKYMGKEDSTLNLPANPSLSLTLDSLCTYVEVRKRLAAGESNRWIAELPCGGSIQVASEARVPDLSESAQHRLIRHITRVRGELPGLFGPFGLRADSGGELELRSANTFPTASGIASSASAFAAITLATAEACCADRVAFDRAWSGDATFRRALARLSRQGSGSSCRSFEGPWVVWEGEGAACLEGVTLPSMTDLIVIVASEAKTVSSSEAHRRVKGSPLWAGRAERATSRLQNLVAALRCGDIGAVSRIAWAELWEMHSLFHTSPEPFSYWRPRTLEILQWIAPFLGSSPAAPVVTPIVTMDAGPNVHILVPTSVEREWEERLKVSFPDLRILKDHQGQGALLMPAALQPGGGS